MPVSLKTQPVNTTPAPLIHDTRLTLNTQAPNLWERIAIACRAKGYSLSTERTYVHWAKAYSAWHGRRHPAKMGAAECQDYLNHLAVDKACSPSTCKQALCALLFLYSNVMGQPFGELAGLQRPRGQTRLPVVLSQAEVRRVLGLTHGVPGLVLSLQYGTGMRLMEALRLRIKDLDLDRRMITVREGKGGKGLLKRAAGRVNAGDQNSDVRSLLRNLLHTFIVWAVGWVARRTTRPHRWWTNRTPCRRTA